MHDILFRFMFRFLFTEQNLFVLLCVGQTRFLALIDCPEASSRPQVSLDQMILWSPETAYFGHGPSCFLFCAG